MWWKRPQTPKTLDERLVSLEGLTPVVLMGLARPTPAQFLDAYTAVAQASKSGDLEALPPARADLDRIVKTLDLRDARLPPHAKGLAHAYLNASRRAQIIDGQVLAAYRRYEDGEVSPDDVVLLRNALARVRELEQAAPRKARKEPFAFEEKREAYQGLAGRLEDYLEHREEWEEERGRLAARIGILEDTLERLERTEVSREYLKALSKADLLARSVVPEDARSEYIPPAIEKLRNGELQAMNNVAQQAASGRKYLEESKKALHDEFAECQKFERRPQSLRELYPAVEECESLRSRVGQCEEQACILGLRDLYHSTLEIINGKLSALKTALDVNLRAKRDCEDMKKIISYVSETESRTGRPLKIIPGEVRNVHAYYQRILRGPPVLVPEVKESVQQHLEKMSTYATVGDGTD